MSSKMNRRPVPSSTVSASSVATDNSVSDSRKRQSRRDDAIRRKIESDLNKKRPVQTPTKKHRKADPGTVLSLKPSEPIICKPSATVYEVAQLMSAKRENCILVVDEYENQLRGIFTAKDLAFRVVGKGLKATAVTIDQIMTPNPMCATTATAASEALNLMVLKGFRHLPVLDDVSRIVGVLDITKCYNEAMVKLERMYQSSKKLYDALDSVNSEMGMGQQPLEVLNYFENLKTKMNGPTLETVLDEKAVPVYVNVKSSVYEATVLMKEHHTTAVLVRDGDDSQVSGIFTSKDVVLRVIAAGLDPKTVSVIRVMTPQPDVSDKGVSIQAALRKMFEGHFLNLPVTEDGEIIGIVEVLKLTYATLHQIKAIQSKDDNGNEIEGPAWNRFWTGFDNDLDSDSVHSDSMLDIPEVTQSELNSFNINDLGPSDSISLNGRSNLNPGYEKEQVEHVPYAFKFKSPIGRVHRISLKPVDGVDALRELITSKLGLQDFSVLSVYSLSSDAEGEATGRTEDIRGNFAISYVDDEGDIVAITSNQDLIDCVLINKRQANEKADLYIHNPHASSNLIYCNTPAAKHAPKNDSRGGAEFIPGVANEVLLSGALLALATSIVIVFSLGRK
ncbi:hypothetical protein BABINDRAFT_160065 [Babjeviella inositovora NRRL Y-12698]|uniref:CBS domain-containing protein n=1 Tax=Babjeviella inositovora NRRL Y-12698 TaxID=984486 RepID=A0A1E3QW99_9ASCO|nr:uncharacterized protein BABINDRAFT_160065 [Babjeviella inositovora NRRL Y-12698]ODQ81834.1 hypothetical protein BABINDRAFT_160065 [Babjeviella inositovora NRRL Y-12698]